MNIVLNFSQYWTVAGVEIKSVYVPLCIFIELYQTNWDVHGVLKTDVIQWKKKRPRMQKKKKKQSCILTLA